MANACIAYDNLADAATITASSAEVAAPVSNLQQSHVVRQWIGMGAGSDYLIADLGSLQSLDSIALIGVDADTGRVRVSSVDSSGATGDLYDSGSVAVSAAYRQIVSLLSAAVSGRYVRIDLTRTSGDPVQAGRLFVGLRTQFSINYSFDWGKGWVDPSIRTRTAGGQTQVFDRTAYRTVDVVFGFLSRTQRYGIVEDIDRNCGLKRDVLLIEDPDSDNLARDTIWGLASELTPVVQPQLDTFSKQYKIEERL